jgi:putative FmdB family regulatory protein
MPLYKVRCSKCNKEFEAFAMIKDRLTIKCSCGSGTTIVPCATGIHIFKADWYEHIDEEPIWIESKKQLKEECDKRGLYAKALD